MANTSFRARLSPWVGANGVGAFAPVPYRSRSSSAKGTFKRNCHAEEVDKIGVLTNVSLGHIWLQSDREAEDRP